MTNDEIYQQMPKPPEGSLFELERVEDIHVTPGGHPYCIGPKHVAEAADHFLGMLDQAAIESAETKGVRCYSCKEKHDHPNHNREKVLFVLIPKGFKDLNSIPGLSGYLYSVKPKLKEFGIDGIAFPDKP
jgi:hypothetical protein